MKTTISLKQLRTDPREYVRLLNRGYEVDITEHSKTIATAIQPKPSKRPQGDVNQILQMINELPPIQVLDPKLDTVAAVKQAKAERLAAKYNHPIQ